MQSDAFNDIHRLRGRMRRLMDDAFPGVSGPPSQARQWSPPADIHTGPSQVIVSLEVPGLTEDDLVVTVQGRALTISGQAAPANHDPDETCLHRERAGGSFQRSFTLAWEPATHSAHLADGVLTVALAR